MTKIGNKEVDEADQENKRAYVKLDKQRKEILIQMVIQDGAKSIA